MSESIIGKRVYLRDNSYQITIGTNENPYLAGTNGYVMGIKGEPTPVTIVSEPFDLCLGLFEGGTKQQTIECIYVKTDDGNFHRAINDWREISPKEREFNNTPQTDAIDWNETNVAQMRDQMRNFYNAMVERNNSIDEKIATLDKQVAEYTASTAGYTSNQLFLNRIKTLEEKFGDFSKWEEGTTVIDFVAALYNVKEEKILELSKQMLARVDRIDAKIESQSKVIQVLNEEVQSIKSGIDEADLQQQVNSVKSRVFGVEQAILAGISKNTTTPQTQSKVPSKVWLVWSSVTHQVVGALTTQAEAHKFKREVPGHKSHNLYVQPLEVIGGDSEVNGVKEERFVYSVLSTNKPGFFGVYNDRELAIKRRDELNGTKIWTNGCEYYFYGSGINRGS